jgi:nucleoside-diphosphate-sugar epimerase
MNVLLTGATGFVGSAILNRLIDDGEHIFAAVRNGGYPETDQVTKVNLNLSKLADHSHATIHDDALLDVLSETDVVIHCAARAHVMNEVSVNPEDELRRLNCDATITLANMAASAGINRFVFISSIGVNGKSNTIPFDESSNPEPHDAYSVSKYKAEQGLLKIAQQTKMEVVIIRPPLVYGPRVPGNFKSLVSWVRKGIPLPFGKINNKRSLVALDNLADFILLCSSKEKSPKAANEVFLISDDTDVSTTDILRNVAKAYGVRSRLIPIPSSVLMFVAELLGKKEKALKIIGNLQVDSSKARQLLNWKAVTSMEKTLAEMAELDK